MKINFHLTYLSGIFLILALPIINAFPFLNLPLWLSPPDFAKTIIFRIILAILCFVFLIQFLNKKTGGYQIIPRVSSISRAFWLITTLFALFLLATIFSQDPLFSLFGDPIRSGGFLNFGLYIVFCLLAFLVLTRDDWKKIWDFCILIGALISVIAVLQQFKILSNIFVSTESRPGSTIGNAVLLSLYLIFLFFLSLIFFLKEQNTKRKIFYAISFLLFLFAIFIAGSRGTYFGLIIGFLYFLFFYQKKFISEKKRKIVLGLKIAFIAVFVLGIFGIYYYNSHKTEISNLSIVKNNTTISLLLYRFDLNLLLSEPRFITWKMLAEAVKEKPILGFGPENLSIAYEKYFDPSLPNADAGQWWDRAHNFLFDIGVTAGIPALLVFISMFGALFYGLQKLKNPPAGGPENYLLYHGLQTVFFAYLANNLFAFDSFASYLILFLLIAFCLKLISDSNLAIQNIAQERLVPKQLKISIICLASIGLVWFVWAYNIKPLAINAEIKSAQSLKNCQSILSKMDNLVKGKSFLDHYVGVKYADSVNECLKITSPEEAVNMVEKTVAVLENNIKIRPTYSRDWLFLGKYNNFLLETTGDKNFKDKAEYYLEKTKELAPKRQDALAELATTYFLVKDYQKAGEISQTCLNISPLMGKCWWTKGLSNIYLKNLEEARLDFKNASKNQYNAYSFDSLSQLMQIYFDEKDYGELIWIHQKLIEQDYKNPQYYAALAYNYKILGDYKMARETCKGMLVLFSNNPEIKKQVNEFLKTLLY